MGNGVSSFLFLSKPEPLKFLLIGLDASGKTTLLYRWCRGEEVVHVIPTIGFNVETSKLPDGSVVTAWDVGGRDKIRPLYRHYYPAMDAVIFVVDSNDEARLDHARDVLHQNVLQEKDLQGRPVLIMCNKQDLPNALSVEEITRRLDVGGDKNIAEKIHVRAVPCVAATGQGIKCGMQWLSDVVKRGKEEYEYDDDDDGGTVATASTVRSFMPSVSPKVPTPRLLVEYEPSKGNLTLEHFLPIQRGTECPFAKAAKLWGGCNMPWDSPEAAKINARALTDFVRRSNADKPLDGFLIEMPGDGGPETLGARVRTVLTRLSDKDPAKEGIMRKSYIGQRGWRFRFAKADFFVTAFAPCYPMTSSRYAFGADRAFLLLQPEMSFLRHKLPPDTPITTKDPQEQTIRDRTRLAFEEARRSYHIPSTTKYPPAEHIVKPLKDDGKTVVQWWAEHIDNI